MRKSGFLGFLMVAVALTGCAQTRDARLADLNRQQGTARETEQNALWNANKGWLLARLPQGALAAGRVAAAFDSYSGSRQLRQAPYQKADYDKLSAFLGGKLTGYRLARPPERAGQLILVDGSAAYLFDLVHREFSGVANLENGLYFAVREVPLERSDERSFAFVPDGQSDATSSWSLYRRDLLQKEGAGVESLGTFSMTRAELAGAGVAAQTDLLTPQQRGERELAQQGLVWLRRAQLKTAQLCSGQDGHDAANKPGGHGKHAGMRQRPGSGSAASEPGSAAATLSDAASSGTSSDAPRFSCRSGSGTLVTDDGISAQVASLGKSGDREITPVIGSTSREIPGGTMTYRYAADPAQANAIWDQPFTDLELGLRSADGVNRLELKLRPDAGATGGSLLMPGEWYPGPYYSISGRELSRGEFAALFLKAYRDCAFKDSQGACKTIPGLFVSLLNAGMAQDLVSYIGAHYLKPAAAAQK